MAPAPALPADTATDSLLLVIPSGPAEARAASPRRRQRYRAHLRRIAAEAVADPLLHLPGQHGAAAPQAAAASTAAGDHGGDDHGDTTSAPGAWAAGDALCGVCGGGCCTLGGDSAHLDANTLRRVLAAQPRLQAADLVAAYLDRVPAQGQLGSCINHSRQGCSLPRDWRSDTCNRFACGALAQLQQRQASAQPASSIVVVQRRQSHWNRHHPGLDNAITACWWLADQQVAELPLPAQASLSGS
jgi:hypothetical protein